MKKVLKWIGLGMAAVLLLAVLLQTGFNGRYRDSDGSYKEIRTSNSWSHIYNHPVWDGSGQSMFSIWGESTVSDLTGFMSVASLSHWCGWNAKEIVSSFNHIVDTANQGRFSLLTIYSEDEITADAELAKAKLAFYRGDANKPVAIIAAGGGYTQVCSMVEAYPYAEKLHGQGYNVLVLRYRVGEELHTADDYGRRAAAAEDLAQAVKYLCEHEAELGISMEGYTLFGSSAGGGLITLFCFDEYGCKYEEMDLPKPATINLIYTDRFLFYTGENGVDLSFTEKDKELALFLIVGENDSYGGDWVLDKKVPEMIAVLGEDNVSYTKYAGFPHGGGLGTGTPAEGWMENAISFWEEHR